MNKREKIELNEYRVHYSVFGSRTFSPLYRYYKGFNLTEDDVKQHHIKVIINELNNDYNDYGIIFVPKHVIIHEIKKIETDE